MYLFFGTTPGNSSLLPALGSRVTTSGDAGIKFRPLAQKTYPGLVELSFWPVLIIFYGTTGTSIFIYLVKSFVEEDKTKMHGSVYLHISARRSLPNGGEF